MLDAASVVSTPEFDLQLAITLAGAAFESYNEPTEKRFLERTINNTETTYVDGCGSSSSLQPLTTPSSLLDSCPPPCPSPSLAPFMLTHHSSNAGSS